MTWEQIIMTLVGTPFEWGARGPRTQDCWGLVLRALELADLPRPGEWAVDTPEEACGIMEEQSKQKEWARVQDPLPGDVVAMSSRRRIHHIGLLTPYGVLHTTRKFGAVVSSERDLRQAGYQRIEYYRWAG